MGVCLGHQVIAAAFGGKIIHADEIVHGKSSPVFHNRSPLYQHIPLPFDAGRYHSLEVDKQSLPTALTITAETSDGVIMGVKHKNYPTYGVQFHPESILSSEGKHIMQNFVALSRAPLC